MDIYYAVTNYHLLCCILHHIKFNKNNSILLISEYLTETRKDLVENIKKSNIFNDVIIIDKPYFKETDEELNGKELKKRIDEICEKINSKYGKIIKESNNIYCCCDFDELGIYIINNKIKYNYFEDGCGIFSREEIVKNTLHQRIKFIDKLKCLGNNENVLKRFGSLKDQEKNYYNEKDIDFCVKDILKKLSSKELNKILKIYNIKKINLKDEKSVLLLTMHYNENKSEEEQKIIYRNLVEYFKNTKEKLIIKPHPADTIHDYAKIFPGSITLERYMPSELFPYCIDGSFKKGITCYSTAIFGLKSVIKKIVSFNPEIDITYKDMDKYFCIVKFLEKIKEEKKINVCLREINNIQLIMMLEEYFKSYKRYFEFVEDKEFDILIIGKKDEKLLEENKNKRIINLDNLDIGEHSILITKKYKNKSTYEFIDLFNFDDVSLEISKKMNYQNYDLECSIIDSKEVNKKLHEINNDLKKEIKELNYLNDRKENEIYDLQKQIISIKNSTSWKMTRIFRKVADMIRRSK